MSGVMELALITPVAYTRYVDLLPGRFCIGPVAFSREDYLTPFIHARNTILDNGIFEDDLLDDKTLIDLTISLRPKVLVVPDIINSNGEENFNRAVEFYRSFVERNMRIDWPIELMYVIQCKRNDEDAFWHNFTQVMTDGRFKWIGICRDAVCNAFSQYTHTEDQELNRLYFSTELQRQYNVKQLLQNGKKFHFLGIGDNVWAIQYYWFVESMDTASFFWAATQGITISDDGVLKTELKRPRNYFTRDISSEVASSVFETDLKYNCLNAQLYAQKADTLRRNIVGGRL